MSTQKKGGDSNITRVKVSKANAIELFTGLREVANEVARKTVRDENRRTNSVDNIFQAVYHYIPQSTDNIRTTKKGFPTLKQFPPPDLVHTKETWEVMGIQKNVLPKNYDNYDQEIQVPITMKGIPIDINDPGVNSR